ncbi:putative wd repeat-containing protein [Erysiphe necator]|uniref:Putative wd repeat-containing protein n=1 Tax=Uncinula necator TaxID=52586 RepID=A0A0B1P7T2_UNCNE|nr:putative wd repeat-containing protein [Erysiphe necator]
MITATTWIRRGVAAPLPSKCVFDEVEYQRIAELTRLQLDDANEDMMDTLESVPDNLNPKLDDKNESDSDISEHMDVSNEEDELKKYDLENYDDEQEMEQDNSDKSLSMFGNLRSLIYYESNADDPYITLPENEEEDEERQELQILPTDNLIIAAKVEDEVANLEIYVYEDEADNLYVHNDIMLPAIPICLEWLEFPVGKTDSENKSGTNFVAVGTLDPDIEIWDLDMIDCMYPNAILGQERNENISGPNKKKKKKKKV